MSPDCAGREDTPRSALWGVDEATLHRWTELRPGTSVTIVKRVAMHGEERARYPATAIVSSLPPPWVVFEAHWTMGTHAQGLLTFENGDILHEAFSPIHPYDGFAVYDPDGVLKGWYANVTYPAFFDAGSDDRVLIWHDLFVDIIAAPSGELVVLDEDELEGANLLATDPVLYRRILTARDELLERFRIRQAPFRSPERLLLAAGP
jgi:hypothetical protein